MKGSSYLGLLPLLFTILLLSNTNKSFGQFQKGIKVNLGGSLIEDFPKPGSDLLTEKIGFSGQLGFLMSYNLSKKLLISSGLELNLIQSSQYNHRVLLNESSPGISGYEERESNKIITNIALPLLLGIRANKLQIHLGLQTSFKLFGKGKLNLEIEEYGIVSKANGDFLNKEYRQFDYGPRIDFIYMLNEKLSLNISYYHGLNNIRSDYRAASSMLRFYTGRSTPWKVRQATIGVIYNLENN